MSIAIRSEQSESNACSLPFSIRSENVGSATLDSLLELLKFEQSRIDELLSLHGGVLFEGFEVFSQEDFSQIARALIPDLKPYIEGQSPRSKVGDNIYTSTEFPAAYRITLHHELSYVKTPPPRIIFHCHTPSETGGETPIVDGRLVYEVMPHELRDKFEQLGVRYLKSMHGDAHGLGKSWMEHFETEDRDEVEAYLSKNDITFEWTSAGGLRTWSNRPGVIEHPLTGEKVWFNQANLWHITNIDERRRAQIIHRYGMQDLPTHACFGDGSPISEREIDEVRNLLWTHAVSNLWKAGDVLLLDNLMVAHGRNSFTGDRKILVVMG